MALSYNSLGIITLLLSTVIAITANRFVRIQYIISGLFFSASVLCCPYLAIVYFLFSLIVLISYIKKQMYTVNGRYTIGSLWLYTTFGIIISSVFFLIFVFSRITFNDLLRVFPLILDDPEHPKMSLITKSAEYFRAVFDRYFAVLFLCISISFAVGKIKRTLKPICFIICIVLTSSYILFVCVQTMYLNFVMFPICLLGLYCTLNSNSKEIKKIFYFIYLPGIIYSFCLHLSSNQQIFAISSASTVAAVAAAIIIFLYYKELNFSYIEKESILRLVSAIFVSYLFIIQISAELFLRYNNVFLEPGSVDAQTVCINSGLERGILVTKERANIYNDSLTEMSIIKNTGYQKVLFLSENTWLYLLCEKEMATYSAWLSGVNDFSINRLDSYYEICTDKKPDLIYVEARYSKYMQHFIAKGYKCDITTKGNYILVK